VNHALKASELRYRRLFEAAQDGILILNAETGQIDDVNPFLTDLLGYSREQLLGNKLWDIGPFKDTKASKSEFRELQREAYVRYEDLPLETSAGKSIHVEFVSNVYRVNGGKVIQCNIRDITERKKAEAKRKEYSRKLQALSRRLVEVQETERRHLARELHDEIGQSLTAIELNLQALLGSSGADSLAPRLKASIEVVERVQEQVHDLSLNLRPSILDDLGLEPALRWYTDRQAALAGLQAEVRAEPFEQRLDPIIETQCFRVAQEALTNVVKHAKARTVTVELTRNDEQLHLSVRDDGVGFDLASVREQAVRGASLGVLSMEERATLAGGGLQYHAHPGQGTEVHAWFPLKWAHPVVLIGAI
jgi:PAS domain S-box-containing protein